ncbi:MAG: lactonase family protein [Bacteroidota bacterium]
MIVLSGGYSKKSGNEIEGGIYTFNFDTKKGILEKKHLLPTINPSYLCLSKNNQFLYTFEETGQRDNPQLKAYSVNKEGQLTPINEQAIPGSAPCHLAFSPDEKFLVVACYRSGSVQVYPVKSDGSLGEITDNAQHKGSSINKNRQKSPHAHMVAFDKLGKVYICDLGIDQVVVYNLVENGKLHALKDEAITIDAGSGPRHMVFHSDGNHAFVLNELTSTVSLLKKEAGKFKVLKNYLSLDGAFSGLPSAAAIRLSKDGHFLYTSDRTINALSIFEFDATKSMLKLIGHQPTSGETPRDFNIDPKGNWLLAAHQNTNNIVVFSIKKKSGELKQVSEIDQIVSPTSIVFID